MKTVRRGMKELIAAGVPVALGHDCVMDPWHSLGSHDMLEVAHMAVHGRQMTGMNEIRALFDAVTTTAARTLHLDGYGLAVGCNGDMVILQAKDPVEAIRLKARAAFCHPPRPGHRHHASGPNQTDGTHPFDSKDH